MLSGLSLYITIHATIVHIWPSLNVVRYIYCCDSELDQDSDALIQHYNVFDTSRALNVLEGSFKMPSNPNCCPTNITQNPKKCPRMPRHYHTQIGIITCKTPSSNADIIMMVKFPKEVAS